MQRCQLCQDSTCARAIECSKKNPGEALEADVAKNTERPVQHNEDGASSTVYVDTCTITLCLRAG